MNRTSRLIALAAALCCAHARADTVLTVDASTPAAAPTTGHLKLGTATGSQGVLAVNSQYLLKDGKPWLPVMGEFHYSRSPASSWPAELAKMKAAGIDVVASYVIWNHHERQDGRFDWRGNRDLRRFLQLARAAGLKAVVRVGPWSHAEVRFGGIPDWVVDAMPTRGDDPEYLRHVERLYAQIGAQLKGMLWKDGGPVIGVQLENEYNLTGPGQGAQHIASLKRLALKAGMDVPLYTVTGWDGTVYPSGEVTPVFGGYPDEPWGLPTTELPPKETYAFRFDTRVSGDLGAQTQAHAPGTAETDVSLTPFLGAEYGAGLPAMYRRRTLVSPDDIASMLPVQLGSGVNLLGYYMFHGGRNPLASPSLEESTASGGYNDTPRINYDFQAPLGPDGQQREVLRRLRPFHLFLQAFGDRLAPMAVRKPSTTPDSPAELTTPRFAVRARGDSGFLFVNNHVRQHAMPQFDGLRFSVRLPSQTLTLPQRPMSLKNGAYFVWPLNFDLDGIRLAYATAQAVTRLDAGRDGIVYVFSAATDLPVELAFGNADAARVDAPDARRSEADGLVVFSVKPGTSPVATVRGARPVRIVVLTEAQARSLATIDFAGQRRLLMTDAQAWAEGGRLELRSTGDPSFRFAVYPAFTTPPKASLPLQAAPQDGLFQTYTAQARPREPRAVLTRVREPGEAPAVLRGGLAGAAMQPAPEAWRAAASWRLAVDPGALKGDDLADILLQPELTGDMARLFSGTRMLDDWYWFGYPWQIGLKSLAADLSQPLTLSVLPLRADAPIYLPREHRPDFAGQAQIARLDGVKLTPVYRLSLGR